MYFLLKELEKNTREKETDYVDSKYLCGELNI